MSFDNPEYDLLAAFRERFGFSDHGRVDADVPPDTRVLSSGEHVYNNAIDVSVSMSGTKNSAKSIYQLMKDRAYSTDNWNQHELHPSPELLGSAEECVKFIFTMDLLNFSFWSAKSEKFTVEYKGKQWSGYYSLVAALRRALDEGVSITSSDFWQNEEECNVDVLKQVFRSTTKEELPLIEERLRCLRDAGKVLYEKYECNSVNVLRQARSSARRLVHLLNTDFSSVFSDKAAYPPDSKDLLDQVRFQKRAQILAADLWACFKESPVTDDSFDKQTSEQIQNSDATDNKGGVTLDEIRDLTDFDDIDHLTTFPDYRIPQMLCSLGVLEYSPILSGKISRGEQLESGGAWEVEIRGCTVWAVEMLRRQIVELQNQDLQSEHSKDAPPQINAVLIDFFLYDLCKEREQQGELDPANVLPHHRTRSIWY